MPYITIYRINKKYMPLIINKNSLLIVAGNTHFKLKYLDIQI